jgi:hypothetical protein
MNNSRRHPVATGVFFCASLLGLLLPHAISQIIALSALFWVYLMVWPRAFWPCCCFLHLLPFVLSPSQLHERGVDLDWIYILAQSGVFYQWARLFGDPWVSSVLYEDSVFHFVLEPWTTMELWYLHLPLAFGAWLTLTRETR